MMGSGMVGYGGFGGFGMGYGLGILWQIIWLVVIVAVIYALLNQFGRGDRKAEGSKAVEILKERLARGEIDYEEYVRIREGLEK